MSDVPEVLSKLPLTTIPDDILSDILSRLPVTSLLRLRCVCKSWKALIESPLVIKQHLNHSRRQISNSNLNKYIFILRDYLNYRTFVNSHALKESLKINSRVVYSEDLDSLTRRGQPNFSKLSHPFEAHKLEIFGSCDGLLVLSTGENDIFLWNPSIRRFKLVPAPGIGFPVHLRCFIVYGFGYDCLSDDYKLVRIVQSYEPSSAAASEVKVYSVKRNCWKQIADFPYYLKVRWGNGELVNGALHWIVGTTSVMKGWSDNHDCLVGAFDLETQDYRLVPLPPKFANYGEFRIVSLGALGGCLTVVCDHNVSGSPYEKWVDFWVMKEYGAVESWSLLFTHSFNPFTSVASSWRYSDMIMPIAYSDCGRKVLVGSSTGGLMWYDLDTKSYDKLVVENIYPKPEVKKTVFDVNFDRNHKYLEVHTCLKSLVLLNDSISDCDFDTVTKTEEEKYAKDRSPSLRMKFLRSWFRCDDD